MIDEDKAAWLRLALVPGVGPAAFLRLLRALGSPETILEATVAQLQPLLKPAQLEALLACRTQPLPEAWTVWLADAGNGLLTLSDPLYPQMLLEIHDPPPVLFFKGDVALLQRPILAIVGSRNATQSGVRHAGQHAEQLSQAGLCIVSGLATGIDAAAHRGALRGAGGTIAVVGTGLDRIYPARNRDLAHAIAAQGLLLSELPLGMPPLAINFPRRNRIISGLALGCLVVEAALESGSLITARLAAEHGREVFAIPGSIDAPQSRGCHQLLKQGAKLVECVNDVLEELNLPSPVSSVKISMDSKDKPQDVPSWLQSLGFDAFDIDDASRVSGLTAGEVCAILFQLEMTGQVATCSGGRFQRMA